MPYKTNGAHIMGNLYLLFVAQLVLFTLFIFYVGKLFIHLLIDSKCK